MSPKELLYIEDALGHQQQLQTQCNDSASRIQDPELQNFIRQMATKHSNIFSQFYSLI